MFLMRFILNVFDSGGVSDRQGVREPNEEFRIGESFNYFLLIDRPSISFSSYLSN